MDRTNTRKLIESALMVSLAVILGMLKLVSMPYSGSITFAAMLPIVILSYRHGIRWGLGAGIVYSVLEQLLGLKNLYYFTTWQSVLALILLDYIIAYTLVGLGGVFRKVVKKQNTALLLGGVLAGVIRFICHTISGATIWAGLSIPTAAALTYSISYNATYMIPETLILAFAGYYVGSVIDFTKAMPKKMTTDRNEEVGFIYYALGGLSFLAAIITDVALIFSKLQDAEDGSFYINGLADVNWVAVIIVSAALVLIGVALIIIGRRKAAKASEHTSV